MASTFGKAEKAYYDKDYSLLEVLRLLWQYTKSERKQLLMLFGLFIANAVISILVPLLLRWGLDELNKQVNVNFGYVKLLGWLYFIGTAVLWVITYLVIRTDWRIISNTVTRLRLDMFNKLQEIDLSFYDRNKTGRIMSRVVNDAWELGNFMLLFIDILVNLITMVAMLFILFFRNWQLTLGILSIVPITLLVMLILERFMIKYSRLSQRTRAAVNSAMHESVIGIVVAKSFSQEARNRKEFHELNIDNLRANIKRSLTFSALFPFFDFISGLVVFIIIFQGARYVISGAITLGDLYLFYSYSLMLMGPIIGIAQDITDFQLGRSSSERIFSLLSVESKIQSGTIDPGRLKGEIEFRDVTFSYDEQTKLFDGLSVHIPAGQNVAIVGHTGSGKTSFISLLAHFYEIKDGAILVDGYDIRALDIDAYRRSLGIVLQDPFLFNGSIRENILYGNPNATEEQLQKVVEISHVKDFVEFLPEGLETNVGERGRRLSLGQRQLVSLARALIADPSILILDEATASVDAYTESLIQDALEELFKGRTSIVIAHRLSTVIGADRILVFQDGKIVGDGTHQELMATNEVYRELYKTYYEFQGVF